MKLTKFQKIFLLFFLTILTIFQAFGEDINSYDYIKVEVSNNIDFEVNLEKNIQISNFEVVSQFLPQTINGTQYLNKFTTNNQDYLINSKDSEMIFTYDLNSLEKENSLRNKFIVQSTIFNPKIYKKDEFPKKSINYQDYLKFYELIDTNNDIRLQASQLAEGEDDVYIIASKIAKWIIEDINYNLSTVTENPNQKSSEVFISKTGVCKEITNLYVSMLRSIGIPARVVSGYAYTDSQDVVSFVGSNWGGHAWAEVLINDEWVPFDLTYNQYGFVDATHIILNQNPTLVQSQTNIKAKGYGFQLVQGSLNVDNTFKIIDRGYLEREDNIEITVFGPQNLKPNSFGYIKLRIRNNDDFYKILFLRLSKTPEVEDLNSKEKMLIFRPKEEKETYFYYQLPDMEGYIFPFSIYNEYLEVNYSVKSSAEGKYLKKTQLPIQREEENYFSQNNLIIDCLPHYSKTQKGINCDIKNPNNYNIDNFEICVNFNCEYDSILINELKNYSFLTKQTYNQIKINYLNKTYENEFNIEKPSLNLTFLQNKAKLTLNYKIENYQQDLKVQLLRDDIVLKTLENQQIEINYQLNQRKNNLKVQLLQGEDILDEESFQIKVDPDYLNESPLEKIYFWFIELFE